MRAAYTGNQVLTFSDYIDAETGRTLTAEPGGVYDVIPASGRIVEDIPEAWFTALGDEVAEGDSSHFVPDDDEDEPPAAEEPHGDPGD